MSVCIIRAYRPIDNIFFYNSNFLATEPDGSMAGGHVASEVAFCATAEAIYFARPETSAGRGRP